jgi:hypothetical protein
MMLGDGGGGGGGGARRALESRVFAAALGFLGLSCPA